MKELFKQRQSAFLALHRKYLPYVLNDHFVLVLIFLLGFILFQYSQILKHFPKNHFPIILFIVAVYLILLVIGKPASYLEAADRHYLLRQEAYIIDYLKEAAKRSFFLWTSISLGLLILLYPLIAKLGLAIVPFLALLVLFICLKWFIQQRKASALLEDGQLNWDQAIAYELARQQGILKFYALFTNVKGISGTFKERKYLNPIIKAFPKKSQHLWTNLYLRAFLRGSDYLGLFIRLSFLSCLSLFFINNQYLAIGLNFVWTYLLYFQLLALYHYYDYFYLGHLYPASNELKKKNLLYFLRILAGISVVLQIIFCRDLIVLVGVVVTILFLTLVYIPYKIKNMID